MKYYRAVMTFRCESEECANTIEKRIAVIAGEEKATEVQVALDEEVYGDIVLPETSPDEPLPARMAYDKIFKPAVL